MARYIDAGLLIGKLVAEKNFFPALVARAIDETPTADVMEVKHGEWKKPQFSGRRGFYSVKDFVCNKCGGAFGIEQGNLLMNYCPNCGAKMDGGGRE